MELRAEASRWSTAGHGHVIQRLARQLETPAHAYLFTGPAGVGKRTLALEFAAALNCADRVDFSAPCHRCRSCRLIEHGNHADVSTLAPVEKEHILVGQVRELREQLAIRPMEGGFRVVVIAADLLTEGAADALLKTLEEPNPQVVLILTAHDVDSVAETIVSRCQVVPLGLVSASVIAAELERDGVEPPRARRLASLAYGAIGWAKRAAGDEDLAQHREVLRDDLVSWGGASLLERLRVAESLSAGSGRPDRVRATVLEDLEILTTWWRDILLTAAGCDDLVVNSTSTPSMEALASAHGLTHAVEVLRAISEAGSRISGNVDPRLTLEALALAI